MIIQDGQRRARVGGELGANGEWYEGGKFIATTDAPKSAPVRYEPSASQLERQAENERRQAELTAWLASRAARFSSEVAALLAHGSPNDVFEGFYPSLGRQLRESGSLTRRQAQFAAKGIFGRLSNKTSDKYEEFIAAATQEFCDRARA